MLNTKTNGIHFELNFEFGKKKYEAAGDVFFDDAWQTLKRVDERYQACDEPGQSSYCIVFSLYN